MTSVNLRRPPHRGALPVPRLNPGAPRGRDRVTSARSVSIVVALAVGAILAGWLIANGETKYVAAALIAVSVLPIALNFGSSAPVIGILLLIVLNGIPGVSLDRRLPGNVQVVDVAVLALAVLLYAYRDRTEGRRTAPYARAVRIWSACFVAWWTFTVARSVLLEGVPIRYALLFGRDFLYFALVLPLALNVRIPARSLRIGALVLLAGVVAYAAGQSVAGLTGITLSWLVHPTHVALVSAGGARFYSYMNHLVDTCVIFAAALFLSRDSPGDRRIVGVIFLLLVASVVLGLTRANYFGLLLAAVVCGIVYARRHGTAMGVLTRGVIAILVVIAGLTLFTAITGHSPNLASNPIVSRISTGLSQISNSTGTFGYRKTVDGTFLQVLGSQWPIGLGFLHPAVHYFPTLPSGSIRDADTGVFNILMTMGLVGTLLFYAPLVYAFRELLRVSRRSKLPRWILYGGIGWVSWIVASSATLVVLFSVPGAVLSALVLALLGWLIRDATTTSALSGAGGVALMPGAVGSANGRGTARAPAPAGAARRMPGPARPLIKTPARRLALPPVRPAPAAVGPIQPAPLAGPPVQPAPSAMPAGVNGASPPLIQARAVPARLSAVIVTYNSGHCIRECIKALRTVLGACEIVVVDNMSVDDTVVAARATDQRVRVLRKGRNAGYGSACNSGVKAATNEHVIVMNPDVRLEHADLEQLAVTIAEPRFGLLAPGLRTDGARTALPQTFAPSTWLGELSTIAFGPFRPRALRRRSRAAEIDAAAWASGALMVVRRSEFMALEGFDERFFLYYEDQDLGIRYRDAGLPIRGTDALTGAHRGGRSVAAENDQRVEPMAWCMLGWLEFVAMRRGAWRAKLSWKTIQATHHVGGRLAEWAGIVTGSKRLRRKAAQLESVEAAVMQIAGAGVSSEHSSCPAACRVVGGKRDR